MLLYRFPLDHLAIAFLLETIWVKWLQLVFTFTMMSLMLLRLKRACEQAMILTVNLGFRSVLVETDSLTIVKRLNSLKEDRSVLSPIIKDIKAIKGLFENITFDFVRRSGNLVAHTLERMGRNFLTPQYWIEEAPLSVEGIVRTDWKKWRSFQNDGYINLPWVSGNMLHLTPDETHVCSFRV